MHTGGDLKKRSCCVLGRLRRKAIPKTCTVREYALEVQHRGGQGLRRLDLRE